MSKASKEECSSEQAASGGGNSSTACKAEETTRSSPTHEPYRTMSVSENMAMTDASVTAAAQSLLKAGKDGTTATLLSSGHLVVRPPPTMSLDEHSRRPLTCSNDNTATPIPQSIPVAATTTCKSSKAPTKSKKSQDSRASAGRWTKEEHELFLEGLKIHGREWKKVAERITTRTSAQIRSHAQKYFAKLAKDGSVIQQNAGSPGAVGGQGSGGGGTGGGSYLSSSVLSKIEKIARDPTGVQQEVETTLQLLHERYRQLQLQLQAAQQREHVPSSDTTSDVGFVQDCRGNPVTAAEMVKQQVLNEAATATRSVADEDMMTRPSGGGRTSISPCVPRSFGNEELIALEVLGGGLPSRKRKAVEELPVVTIVQSKKHCVADDDQN